MNAAHTKEAEGKALLRIREDENLKKMMRNGDEDPPILFVEKIAAIEPLKKESREKFSYNFFVENEAEIDLTDFI